MADEESERPDDDKQATYQYSSDYNISMQGEGGLEMTKGEWRRLSQEERDAVIQEILNDLVEVWVDGDE